MWHVAALRDDGPNTGESYSQKHLVDGVYERSSRQKVIVKAEYGSEKNGHVTSEMTHMQSDAAKMLAHIRHMTKKRKRRRVPRRAQNRTESPLPAFSAREKAENVAEQLEEEAARTETDTLRSCKGNVKGDEGKFHIEKSQ